MTVNEMRTWRIISLNFLISGPMVFISVYLPLVLQDKSFSLLEIGMVLSLGSLVGFVGQMFWGFMSDKFGTIRYISLSVILGTCLLFAGLYVSVSFIGVLVIAVVVRFFTTSLLPFTDLWTLQFSESKGKDFGIYRQWGSIGLVVLTLLFGVAATLGDLSAASVVHLSILILCFLLVWEMKEQGRKPLQTTELMKGFLIFLKPQMLLFSGAVLLINIPARAFEGFFSIYIKQMGGSDMMIAIIAVIAPLCEIPFFIYGSRWIRNRGITPVLMTSALFYGAVWIFYIWNQSVLLFAISQIVFGGAHVLFYVAAMIHMRKHVPEILQSTGQLFLFMLMGTLSGTVGNLLAGQLLLRGKGPLLFGMSAGGTLLALLLFLLLQIAEKIGSKSIGKDN